MLRRYWAEWLHGSKPDSQSSPPTPNKAQLSWARWSRLIQYTIGPFLRVPGFKVLTRLGFMAAVDNGYFLADLRVTRPHGSGPFTTGLPTAAAMAANMPR